MGNIEPKTIRQTNVSLNNNNGSLSGTINYDVFLSNNYDDPLEVIKKSGVPNVGIRLYNRSGNLGWVNQVTASRGPDRIEGLFLWKVTVSFGPRSYTSTLSEDVDFQWQISRSSEFIERAMAADVNGRTNCNVPFGEMFEDALILRVPVIVWTFSGKLCFNPECWMTYEHMINNDAHWGLPRHSLLFDSLSYSHLLDKEPDYFDTKVVVKYNPFGWDIQKANVGYYAYIDNDIKRIYNEDGSPKEQPSFLSSDGTVTETPSYITFQEYPEFNFSVLNLRNPFA